MAPAAQNLMAARSGRGLFRTGSSVRGLPTSPLARSGSLPHLSWAFAKGKSKVHPDDEAKDGDDDAVATLSSTPDDAVVLVDVSDGEHACACCGARATKQVPVKACTGCHRVAYCSRKCQASHWKKGHRKLCPRLRALGVI